MNQGQTIALECIVLGGKPAPELVWLKNGFKIKESKELMSTTTLSPPDEQLTKKSVIQVTPSPDDNGNEYSCEAHHKALIKRLKQSVVLSVLFPPGKPIIRGYSDGEFVRSGDTLQMECLSIGGNPLAQLIWYKNDEQIDFSFTTTTNKQSQNALSVVIDPNDNNAIYRCVASSSSLAHPLITEIKLKVHFPPAKVHIKGPKQVKAGDNVTVTCLTERSNPAAEISWVLDGRPLIGNNKVEQDSAGGWVTSSNVTFTITNQVKLIINSNSN